MRFPLSWLRDYVDFDVSPEELALRLTMAGLEVEELVWRGKELVDIVVAEILAIRSHPNAERLTLCDVYDGERVLKIVCGAKNMKPGDKVALAPHGALLPPSPKFPEGVRIKRSKIRGEVSEGMLCSESELGLGEESGGIMVLPPSSKVGGRLVDELGLLDAVMDVAVTPNRPDCLSVVGIAREVSAILRGKPNVRFHPPVARVDEGDEDTSSLVSVEVLDGEGCPRYSCRVVSGVEIARSPAWLSSRLEAAGVRSINNVVDVTNYVLLEMGQPLHAFDYDLIEGRRIVVRKAREGEAITTLDGAVRTLSREDLVICDAVRPVALAGIMGGAETEVTPRTRRILIESAYFDPRRVRRTSKRLGLRSESSFRFERGVDPDGVTRALDRAASLIAELAGGVVARGVVDVYPERVKPREIELSVSRLNSTLGTTLIPDEIMGILVSLGMEVRQKDPSALYVSVPTFRVDVEREIDLVEEVARLHGYDSIPTTTPLAPMATRGGIDEWAVEERVRGVLIAGGFMECINYSFEDPRMLSLFSTEEPIMLMNPIAQDLAGMRTTLLAGLVKNLVLNLRHQEEELRLFEVGRCFMRGEGALPKEILKVAGVAAGARGVPLWDRKKIDFFDLKGVLENVFESIGLGDSAGFERATGDSFLHPGKSARVYIAGEGVGFVGALHPSLCERLDIAREVYLFELDLALLARLAVDAPRELKPIPRFPSLRRDLSLIVDEGVSAGEIIGEIRGIGIPIIEDAVVFDVFAGGTLEKGKKSVSVSLTLRSSEKTLTDEEANEVQSRVIASLKSSLGTELRKT